MPLANDHHYTPRQPLNRRTLRHAPSTPLLQHLPHPSYEYNSEFANRYNHPPPRPPNPDQYVTHTLHSSTVHWSGVPHHRLPAIAIPGSSNASAYGDPHTAAHLVTVTSFDPALERERNKARITNHQNFLPRPFVRKDTLYDSFNRSNKNLTEVDGAGDIRKLLQGANITSIKNRVSQDFRRVLGRRSSEAQMNNRYSGSPKKTPLEHLKHLLPSRARARREEEEARRKEAEAFLRSGKRNAGHARIIQIPPHHHMNPTDSLSSGEREEYMQRTEAEIAEDRKRVGEFLFGDRPTLDLTERRSKQKRATGVSDSVMDPYLHKPLPVPAITRERNLRRISLPVLPRGEQVRKMSLGGGRYPRLERKPSISTGLRNTRDPPRETREPVRVPARKSSQDIYNAMPERKYSQDIFNAIPERKYSGALRNSRRRSVQWKQPTVESNTQGSETAEIRSITSSLSFDRERRRSPHLQRRDNILKPEEWRPSPPSSQEFAAEPPSPQLGNRADEYLQASESFWDTADSFLPYVKTPQTYKDVYNPGATSSYFWNKADQKLELPQWRQSTSNLDQWLDNLPNWNDGYLQEFSEKIKAETPRHSRESAVTPPNRSHGMSSDRLAERERQRRKSEGPKASAFQLQSILEENTASRSDMDTPTSVLNLALKKGKDLPPKPHATRSKSISLSATNLRHLPSPPITGENSARAGVEGLSPGEVEEISQSLVEKLSELEVKWKNEGVEMNGVLKRMLYVVDKLVLDDWAEEQRKERGIEMGWGK